MPTDYSGPVLTVDSLSVEYHTRHGRFCAVDDVSLSVGQGETVGLVGESGSGKTTLARAVLGLAPASTGRIVVCGEDLTRASRRVRRRMTANLSVVPQDPYGSLNPALKVRHSLSEAMPAGAAESLVLQRMEEMLGRVGLPLSAAEKYPGNFSGGQRQRIAIARALMPTPRLIICDEPVSALDVSVQAQVLNLLRECQRDLGVSYLFIGHDLDVVRFMSDSIVVLYRGQVMEQGPAERVSSIPQHPYTRALVKSAPSTNQPLRRSAPPALSEPREPKAAQPNGCPFAPRCLFVVDQCRDERPPLLARDAGGSVACHRADEAAQLFATPHTYNGIPPRPGAPGPSPLEGSVKE
jgi:peptide/nickel transport system ATP-binding protein